jgi:transposase-like protein
MPDYDLNCRDSEDGLQSSRAVGIFPSSESYIRLLTAYLIEYEEDWQPGRAYSSAKSLIEQQIELEKDATLSGYRHETPF